MNSANSKILNAKTVYSTVKQQAWSAVIAVGALLVTLFLVGSSYFVGIVKSVNAERDIPHDAELRFGLLLGGLLLHSVLSGHPCRQALAASRKSKVEAL